MTPYLQTTPQNQKKTLYKKKPLTLACVIAWIGTPISPSYALDIVAQTDFSSSVRTRFSTVEEGNNSGQALSALLRATAATAWHEQWSSLLELDYVARAFKDQHSTGVIRNGEPVIQDTDGFDLNQLAIQFDYDTFQGRLGRQRIEFDNQRFIGGNAFWQNEQTFDGLTTELQIADSSSVHYAAIINVNRIFGEKAGRHLSESDEQFVQLNGKRPFARLGDHDVQSHWFRTEWNEWDYQRISGYAYFNEYLDAPDWSHRQAGLRHLFDYKFSDWRLRTQLEYARQERYELANARTTAYQLVETALGYNAFELAARHEKLGSKNALSFITPLGSLHDFHGSVGKFATIPDHGLVEHSVRLSWRQAPWLIELRHFKFESAKQSIDLGRETDLSLRWRSHRVHNVIVNAGRYSDSELPAFKDEWRTYLDYRFEF